MSNLESATAGPWATAPTMADAMRSVRESFPFPECLGRQIPGCVNVAQAVLRHLPAAKTTRILDFGCGPGEKPAALSALGYRCSAYDDLGDDWHKLAGAREKILKFAAEMGVEFELADGPGLPWGARTFDLVMLNDVIEHLHDSPRTLLTGLLQLVKEDGFLLITVPNAVNIRKRIDVLLGRTNMQNFTFFFWYPDPWRGHVREYTKGDLRLLCEHLALKTVELKTCDHMLGRIPAPLRPLYRAVTAIFPGWKDTWLLLAQKEKGWQPPQKTRAELSRLFSAFGAGAYPSEASEASVPTETPDRCG